MFPENFLKYIINYSRKSVFVRENPGQTPSFLKKRTPRHSVRGGACILVDAIGWAYAVASATDVSTGFFLPLALGVLGAADSSTTSSTTGATLPGSLTFLATLPSCLTIFRNSSGFVSNVLSPSGYSARGTSPPSKIGRASWRGRGEISV